MLATTDLMPAMTCAKLTCPLTFSNPNWSPRRKWLAYLAERISALEGTQPVLRQSPPISFFSIRVTFAFTAAAM